MAEGIIGYPFFCPDMIGGGEMGNFLENNVKGVDRELFVRWVQVSALMPMMQFSYAPWKLDSTVNSICRKYAEIHRSLGDYIYSLAIQSSETGIPIVKPLFFRNPEDEKTYAISDQFMLGDRFLVAPVLKKGDVSRDIYLPKGTWVDYWDGKIFQGNTTLQHYAAPIEKLPIFISIL